MSAERESEVCAATVGDLKLLAGPVRVVDSDPEWPHQFGAEADSIRRVLGTRVFLLEHAGSTSVPSLPAKPVIDIVVAVADSADECRYVPDLEAAGYRLCIREPEWHEHRMLRGSTPEVNLHVFTMGSPEIARMLLFRDWLRESAEDRELYSVAKRALAKKAWKYMQQYADAKTEVIAGIMARADTWAAGRGVTLRLGNPPTVSHLPRSTTVRSAAPVAHSSW